jgi:phosphoglycerol transferase MdoB-like AlkP superfamily enzyme
MLLPIIGILVLPLFSYGLSQLPYALLMIAVVVIPLLVCGFDFKGRPLFQFSYHGEPFVDEVMNIRDDEQIFQE